jgi:hypothetical protein
MPKSPFSQLSDAHRRSIEVTLAFLDEALCEFENWAVGRERHSVFYSEVNPLSPEQRQTILFEVARMRDLLQELRGLGLEGRTQNAGNIIWGKCSTLWVDLQELESKRLSRYGALPPGIAKQLDPHIERLIEHLQKIFSIADVARNSK